MKKLTVFLFFSMFLFACSDPCDDVNCGANGSCDEDSGTCLCDNWYEGNNCEIETRTKFIGTWTSTSNCVDQNGVAISPSWTIEPLAAINGFRVRSSNTIGDIWLNATLLSENAAVFGALSLGDADNTGSIIFVNESSLTISIDTGVTCVYDLVK